MSSTTSSRLRPNSIDNLKASTEDSGNEHLPIQNKIPSNFHPKNMAFCSLHQILHAVTLLKQSCSFPSETPPRKSKNPTARPALTARGSDSPAGRNGAPAHGEGAASSGRGRRSNGRDVADPTVETGRTPPSVVVVARRDGTGGAPSFPSLPQL